MATQIFINLPVKDLNKSVEFFTKLGYSFNPQFTNEDATMMIIDENIYVMLLVEKFFKTFTKKEITDTATTTEAIFCLSAESRETVDELVDKAMAAGAAPSNYTQDQGFMYGRSFQDLDGHLWEVMYMEPSAISEGQQVAETADK
jgi:predicted lactoylglutathione lyase